MRTARLLTISQHALHRGVYLHGGGVPAWGVYLPGGTPAGGVYLPGAGGVPAGGVPARGCNCQGMHLPGGVSQHTMGQTPLWTDRHLWKHNLRQLRLQAVKMWFMTLSSNYDAIVNDVTDKRPFPLHEQSWYTTAFFQQQKVACSEMLNDWAILTLLVCLRILRPWWITKNHLSQESHTGHQKSV